MEENRRLSDRIISATNWLVKNAKLMLLIFYYKRWKSTFQQLAALTANTGKQRKCLKPLLIFMKN